MGSNSRFNNNSEDIMNGELKVKRSTMSSEPSWLNSNHIAPAADDDGDRGFSEKEADGREMVEENDTAAATATETTTRRSEDEEKGSTSTPPVEENLDEPPDGGYGWVNVVCIALSNTIIWGPCSAFGVFLSFYQSHTYFPGTTSLQYAFVGGSNVAFVMLPASLANFMTKKFGFKVPMLIGAAISVAAQVGAAFAKTYAQLLATQGILLGFGMSLMFIPPFSLPSQWFKRRRGIAMGLCTAGTGLGGLMFSLITRATIEGISLRGAFLINALICGVIEFPIIFLLRWRGPPPKLATFDFTLLYHPGFIWILLFGLFSQAAYTLSLFSLPSYATKGLGLSQATGANLSSVLAIGQIVGRPGAGFVCDRGGRINMTILISIVAACSSFFLWKFSTTTAPLYVYAFVQGVTGGIFWSASAVISAEVVGVPRLGSALVVLWLAIVGPSLIAEPAAIWLIDKSYQMGKTGADAYTITICFAGGCFTLGALLLLGSKRYVQGNWRPFTKA